jgi:hypothetical protein
VDADPGWARATRPDGQGGWYAMVEVVGHSTGPPRGGIDEYYGLRILGTSQSVGLVARDLFLSWWPGDLFVAHLRPRPRGGSAADPEGAGPLVVGLVPIEPGDTSTLDEIAEGRRPMPDAQSAWPREWHQLVIVEVTRDRRWRTTSPLCSWRESHCKVKPTAPPAGLGPTPRAAKVGAHFAFVLVAGKVTRQLGEIDPRERDHVRWCITAFEYASLCPAFPPGR